MRGGRGNHAVRALPRDCGTPGSLPVHGRDARSERDGGQKQEKSQAAGPKAHDRPGGGYRSGTRSWEAVAGSRGPLAEELVRCTPEQQGAVATHAAGQPGRQPARRHALRRAWLRDGQLAQQPVAQRAPVPAARPAVRRFPQHVGRHGEQQLRQLAAAFSASIRASCSATCWAACWAASCAACWAASCAANSC